MRSPGQGEPATANWENRARAEDSPETGERTLAELMEAKTGSEDVLSRPPPAYCASMPPIQLGVFTLSKEQTMRSGDRHPETSSAKRTPRILPGLAKRRHRFQLETTVAQGAEAVEGALREFPWVLLEKSEGHLAIREDATRLCCTISPVSVEIRVRENGPSHVEVQLDGSVPGWGMIASRQLRDRLAMLERMIREDEARLTSGMEMAEPIADG